MKQKSRLQFRNLGAALTLAGGIVGTAGFVGAVSAPIAAHAQTAFMVVRPENGATVRETVHIQMSRKALDDLGVKYLSVSLDGKFKEAVAILKLPADGKPMTSDQVAVSPQMVALLWNTKLPPEGSNGGVNPLGVEDGQHTIEITAQAADGRRLGSQTLTLNVLNRGGLQIPADGLEMAYHFQLGDTSKYREQTVVEYEGEHTNAPPPGFSTQGGGHYLSPGFGSNFSGSGSFGGGQGGPGASMGMSMGSGGGQRGGPGGGFQGGGGRFGGPPGGGFGSPGGGYDPGAAAGPFTVLVENVRANYERTTEDSEGGDLYFLRDKVVDGTFISGSGSAGLLQDIYSLKSRYRTVHTSGSVSDPGLANAEHPGAYIAMPIPNLGGGRRRIGQEWKTLTPIKLEWATLDKPPVVEATNKLEGLEWQDGYQTARILQTFDGKADIPIFGGAGVIKGADVHMSQTIWFAYRAGKIIRMETDMTVNGATPASLLASMVPGAGVNAGLSGAGGFGSPGMGAMGFPGGGPGGEEGKGGFGQPGGGGGFGQLVSTQPQEEARVPAKFHSTSTVQLLLPGMK
jgi:hypothetical protein